jgi:hypothetical protein
LENNNLSCLREQFRPQLPGKNLNPIARRLIPSSALQLFNAGFPANNDFFAPF